MCNIDAHFASNGSNGKIKCLLKKTRVQKICRSRFLGMKIFGGYFHYVSKVNFKEEKGLMASLQNFIFHAFLAIKNTFLANI